MDEPGSANICLSRFINFELLHLFLTHFSAQQLEDDNFFIAEYDKLWFLNHLLARRTVVCSKFLQPLVSKRKGHCWRSGPATNLFKILLDNTEEMRAVGQLYSSNSDNAPLIPKVRTKKENCLNRLT